MDLQGAFIIRPMEERHGLLKIILSAVPLKRWNPSISSMRIGAGLLQVMKVKFFIPPTVGQAGSNRIVARRNGCIRFWSQDYISQCNGARNPEYDRTVTGTNCIDNGTGSVVVKVGHLIDIAPTASGCKSTAAFCCWKGKLLSLQRCCREQENDNCR